MDSNYVMLGEAFKGTDRHTTSIPPRDIILLTAVVTMRKHKAEFSKM